jgi:hypothetical protein
MNEPIYYRDFWPGLGEISAIREPDGSDWFDAWDVIEGFAEYIDQTLGKYYGGINDEFAKRLFRNVPSQYKEVKLFHTVDGFKYELGITVEGIMYYLQHLPTKSPKLTLVK